MKMTVPARNGIDVVHDLTRSIPTALVYLRGTIDTECGPLLRNILAKTVGVNVHVTVDLSKVASVNVGGLFALHAAAIDIRILHEGILVLRHVADSTRGLLQILPLNLPIEETVEWESPLTQPLSCGLCDSQALQYVHWPSTQQRKPYCVSLTSGKTGSSWLTADDGFALAREDCPALSDTGSGHRYGGDPLQHPKSPPISPAVALSLQ
jgi:anti-anti-sigma regulatory factor